jgi:hypothetical protein
MAAHSVCTVHCVLLLSTAVWCIRHFKLLGSCHELLLCLGCYRLQVRWLARLSDPAVRFVDTIIGEAVVSGRREAWLLH